MRKELELGLLKIIAIKSGGQCRIGNQYANPCKFYETTSRLLEERLALVKIVNVSQKSTLNPAISVLKKRRCLKKEKLKASSYMWDQLLQILSSPISAHVLLRPFLVHFGGHYQTPKSEVEFARKEAKISPSCSVHPRFSSYPDLTTKGAMKDSTL